MGRRLIVSRGFLPTRTRRLTFLLLIQTLNSGMGMKNQGPKQHSSGYYEIRSLWLGTLVGGKRKMTRAPARCANGELGFLTRPPVTRSFVYCVIHTTQWVTLNSLLSRLIVFKSAQGCRWLSIVGQFLRVPEYQGSMGYWTSSKRVNEREKIRSKVNEIRLAALLASNSTALRRKKEVTIKRLVCCDVFRKLLIIREALRETGRRWLTR